jgi:vacuolar-type H+-ATPase subunit H
MSILETMSRVREAEQQAEGIVDEARKNEQEEVARALRRRQGLLREASAAAGKEAVALREKIRAGGAHGIAEVTASTAREKQRLREVALGHFEGAARRAHDIFLAAHRKD